ncbi:MAG: molybdopterin-dependent oxidoreductase [Actinomycetota bacterium]|nr:molybdopterin-dependent oxidoreductase [Actinomycetota bacterium]
MPTPRFDLTRLFPDKPPPGPTRREFWRSPLRGPWLTAALGRFLLIAVPVIFVTGLLSHAAYSPQLGDNGHGRGGGPLDFYVFAWPSGPAWLYAVTQGLHVTVGIVTVPLLLVKLWSVIPKLFEWPPVRSVAHGLERVSIALLVGSALFQFTTGIFNVQLYYPWRFSFLSAHYYGAWVFIGAFAVHVALKLPLVIHQLRARPLLAELRVDLAGTQPERAPTGAAAAGTAEPSILIPVAPSEPTLSRRGLFGIVGASSLSLLILTVGQSIGGPLRQLALLAPHGRDLGDGPNDFQVNKTARSVGIDSAATGAGWRLRVKGAEQLTFSRAELLALPQHSYDLPIACVEGWSTTQRWTGVRLRDLADMAGGSESDALKVESLQRTGSFRRATLEPNQVQDDRSLLALKVNGADLSLDHGFPARVIVPALPGVHCTKWVSKLEFTRA